MIPSTGRSIAILLLAAAAATAGCASSRQRGTGAEPLVALQPLSPTTAPADAKAYLPLERIPPQGSLSMAPATEPAGPPPLAALELYAKARDALVQGERFTAIGLLEKTVALDPYSYDAWFDLGKAYLSVANMEEKGIDALEHAARLEPNHLDLQIQLGRQYLSRGEDEKSIRHLRMALRTDEYAADDAQAAVADFFLARALQQAGYDRAALDRYNLLMQRLRAQASELRQNPELALLLERPELLFLEIGQLYEKHGAYAQALAAYEPLAERSPDNLELAARVARMLASLGRRDDALARCAELIVRTRAAPESLSLLAEVCQRLNLSDGVVSALTRLHHDRPDDRAVLLALCDTLLAQQRPTDAQRLLVDAWQRSPGDLMLTRRLFALDMAAGQKSEAARMLVIALSRNPDALRSLSPLWNQLVRPSRLDRLPMAAAQSLSAPADAQASKLLWLSRTADLYHRDTLAQQMLERAVLVRPPFPPAFRELVNNVWDRDQLSAGQKIAECDRLAALAQSGGNAALAEEVRGLCLVNQKNASAGAVALAQAIAMSGSNPSPELTLEYALALHSGGRDPHYEHLLQSLTVDHPLFGEAYALLFRYYADASVADLNSAVKVLGSWLGADPQSIAARLLEASVDSELGSPKEAQSKLERLFDEYPDDPDVLNALGAVDAQAGMLDVYESTLEQYRKKHPDDVEVAERLVAAELQQKRPAEAKRVADETRSADAGDAELLYSVSQIYSAMEDKPDAEATLQQVVRLDPTQASASNDLGFELADQGRDLPQAESLVRVAVAAEPDNGSFLDSLGWVLYKRGKFEAALSYLQRATGESGMPDPVILDHLGDTLYRLSQPRQAADAWQRSLKGIGEADPDRDDLKQLRGQLQQKLKEYVSKQPVDVAPVGK